MTYNKGDSAPQNGLGFEPNDAEEEVEPNDAE